MNIKIIKEKFLTMSRFLRSNVYSSRIHEHVADSFERFKNKSSGIYGSGSGFNKSAYNGYSDFSEYPVISCFIEKYGWYPSAIKYDFCANIDLFIEKTKLIKKDFMTDTYHRWIKEGQEFNQLSFCCFNDSKNHLYFYVTIDSHQESIEFHKISLTCFFDGRKYQNKQILDIIKNDIYNLPEPKFNNKGFLNVLVYKNNSFGLEKIEIKFPEIDFDLNYNSDFKPIHDIILKRLSEDKSKGLVLLHGKAGTGKTNYIRYLINHLKKKVIYIPPNMSNSISDPNLIKFFIEHSNSVLVIEDAENVLMKRNSNSSQAISNILNLTDGLLSDCTNIQVIATFNTDVLNIDEALLRKGRLICKYEFGELEPEITEKLAIKIGSDIRGKKTLAEIYNSKDESFTNKKEKIGFNK